MVTIAYNKDSKQILGFIIAEYEINPKEVFDGFENYEVIKTEIKPPFKGYNKYMVNIENNELKSYIKINE